MHSRKNPSELQRRMQAAKNHVAINNKNIHNNKSAGQKRLLTISTNPNLIEKRHH